MLAGTSNPELQEVREGIERAWFRMMPKFRSIEQYILSYLSLSPTVTELHLPPTRST